MNSPSVLTPFERFKERVVGKIDLLRGKCWLIHYWSKWCVVREYTVSINKDQALGHGFQQRRQCLRCGLTQEKHQTSFLLEKE